MLTGHLNKAEFYVLHSPDDETQGWSKITPGMVLCCSTGTDSAHDTYRIIQRIRIRNCDLGRL